MRALVFVVLVSVVAAALEAVFRYLRDHRTSQWSMRPVIVGTIGWAIALFIVQRYQSRLDVPLIALNSVVGGIVWFAVTLVVGRRLWQPARRISKRR